MKGKSLLSIGAALILASSLMPQSWAQSDGLDVTMRVLDDASDIAVVIASIDNQPLGAQPDQPSEERGPSESSASGPARAQDPRGELGLESEFDREEESEAEIEDFDAPDDVVLP